MPTVLEPGQTPPGYGGQEPTVLPAGLAPPGFAAQPAEPYQSPVIQRVFPGATQTPENRGEAPATATGQPEWNVPNAAEGELPPAQTGDGRTWVNNVRGHYDSMMTVATFGLYPFLQAAFDDLFSDASYSESLTAIPENIDATRQDSPVTMAAADAAGAIVPVLLTGGAAAPAVAGQRAATAAATPLARAGSFALRNIAWPGVSGATGAAIYGFNEGLARSGGDVNTAVQTAQEYAPWGAGIGIAAPMAFSAAPLLARAARNALPSQTAARRFTQAVDDPAAVAGRMAENPAFTAADVSPAAAQFAREAAQAKPGIAVPFARRQSELPETVQAEISRALGEVPNGQAYYDKLRAQARAVGQQQIQPAIENAGPVNIGPVVYQIDGMVPQIAGIEPRGPLTQTLLDIKAQLEAIGTDPVALHQFQHDLRILASDLRSSSDGMQRNLARSIDQIRQTLVDQIDVASGGAYRPALAAYRDEMDIQNAFQRGLNDTFYNPRRGTENVLQQSPEAWQQWVDGLTPEELQAARLGARAALENLANSVRGKPGLGTAVMQRMSSNERARLAALFGEDQVNQLLERLAQIDVMASTGDMMAAAGQADSPSSTMRFARMALQAIPPAVTGTGATLASGNIAQGAAVAAGTRLADAIFRRAAAAREKSIANRLAAFATTPGEAGQAALYQIAPDSSFVPSELVPSLTRAGQGINYFWVPPAAMSNRQE